LNLGFAGAIGFQERAVNSNYAPGRVLDHGNHRRKVDAPLMLQRWMESDNWWNSSRQSTSKKIIVDQRPGRRPGLAQYDARPFDAFLPVGFRLRRRLLNVDSCSWHAVECRDDCGCGTGVRPAFEAGEAVSALPHCEIEILTAVRWTRCPVSGAYGLRFK
jgi:hypothetical protein